MNKTHNYRHQCVVVKMLEVNQMTQRVTCFDYWSIFERDTESLSTPTHTHTFYTVAASLMGINNVSHESFVHTQGQRSHNSCNLYASEMLSQLVLWVLTDLISISFFQNWYLWPLKTSTGTNWGQVPCSRALEPLMVEIGVRITQ